MTAMKKIKSGKVFLFALILVLWAIVFATMFYKLGCAEVCQTDEATHGVNAYEMIQSGNWIVNTYRYCIDYFNSKPPLSLWLIKASYMIFGYSSFALRFPAGSCDNDKGHSRRDDFPDRVSDASTVSKAH